MYTLNTLFNNPMMPVALAFLAIMVGFVITLLRMDGKPSKTKQARIDAVNAEAFELRAQLMTPEEIGELPVHQQYLASRAKAEYHLRAAAAAVDDAAKAYHKKMVTVYVLLAAELRKEAA